MTGTAADRPAPAAAPASAPASPAAAARAVPCSAAPPRARRTAISRAGSRQGHADRVAQAEHRHHPAGRDQLDRDDVGDDHHQPAAGHGRGRGAVPPSGEQHPGQAGDQAVADQAGRERGERPGQLRGLAGVEANTRAAGTATPASSAAPSQDTSSTARVEPADVASNSAAAVAAGPPGGQHRERADRDRHREHRVDGRGRPASRSCTAPPRRCRRARWPAGSPPAPRRPGRSARRSRPWPGPAPGGPRPAGTAAWAAAAAAAANAGTSAVSASAATPAVVPTDSMSSAESAARPGRWCARRRAARTRGTRR